MASAPHGWPPSDFDGDGCDDLAVGVPLEDLSGVVDAGVVDVLYGSADGLTGSGGQQLAQALPEPGETVGAAADAGAVEVYAGVNTQPIPDGGRLMVQHAPGVPGTSETGDIFGVGLARLVRGARVLTRPAA